MLQDIFDKTCCEVTLANALATDVVTFLILRSVCEVKADVKQSYAEKTLRSALLRLNQKLSDRCTVDDNERLAVVAFNALSAAHAATQKQLSQREVLIAACAVYAQAIGNDEDVCNALNAELNLSDEDRANIRGVSVKGRVFA